MGRAQCKIVFSILLLNLLSNIPRPFCISCVGFVSSYYVFVNYILFKKESWNIPISKPARSSILFQK